MVAVVDQVAVEIPVWQTGYVVVHEENRKANGVEKLKEIQWGIQRI